MDVMILVFVCGGGGVAVLETVTVEYTGDGVAIVEVPVTVTGGRVIVLMEVLAGRVTVLGGRDTVS